MRDAISLTPHYHFHAPNRHLSISRVITPESSPLQEATGQALARNLRFPSTDRICSKRVFGLQNMANKHHNRIQYI